MKTKKFSDYLETRLSVDEISEIEEQAKLEALILKSLQSDIVNVFKQYMDQEKVGFNEMVRRLGISPTLVSSIQKGEANLTLATIAHLYAVIGKTPTLASNSAKYDVDKQKKGFSQN